MTHDLFIHPVPGGPLRSFEEVAALLRDAETLAPYVSAEDSTPEQLVLHDPDTGVWALLTAGGPWLDEEHEPDPHVLHLQIPYARPRFFAIEGALFAMALVQELGGLIEDPKDPRDPKPRPRKEEEIVASWDLENAALLAKMKEPAESSGGSLPVVSSEGPRRLDAELLASVFSQNLHRRELRERAGPEIEIPRLFLASLPLQIEPAIVCIYTAGEKVWLPDLVTHVVLYRRRKGWLGSKEEAALVEGPALRELLSQWEQADEAPKGMRSFHPLPRAADPAWRELGGREARGLAVLDWNELADA